MNQKPITIERTSKSVKLGMVIAAVAFWYGLIVFLTNLGGKDHGDFTIGAMLLLGGAVGWFALKARRWWVNG